MSLYNMVYGVNPDADKLLSILDLCREQFKRFRDCYLNADGTEIIVYTRCGGDNRKDYDEVFEQMKQHNNYIIDYDDEFDETYCYFTFDVPIRYINKTRGMATGKDPLTVGEKFKQAAEEMKKSNSDAAKKAEEVAKTIMKGIEENPKGGIIRL